MPNRERSKRETPNVLATLSKARQRSKVLTVAASCRRAQRGSAGTLRRAQRVEEPAEQQEDEGPSQKHFLLFTSTYADGLDVKAKTERIKMILDARKLQYDEIDLYTDPEIRQDMEELSGDGNTLPQLFIDGDYLVDGLEELQYLHDNDLL